MSDTWTGTGPKPNIIEMSEGSITGSLELDRALADIKQLHDEVERLKGIIRNVEWGKSVHTAWDKYQRCAICGNKQSDGHDINCPFYQWEGER